MRIDVSEDVQKKLAALKKNKAKAAIRKGSRAAAKLVAANAKAHWPKKTGASKRQVKVRALPRSRTRVGTRVQILVAGTPAYYAAFMELGTRKMKSRAPMKLATKRVGRQATTLFLATIAKGIG